MLSTARRVLAIVAVSAGAAGVAACGGDDGGTRAVAGDGAGSASRGPSKGSRNTHVVAEARVPQVRVFAAPEGAGTPVHTLANPTENGGPLVFLVEEQRGDWLHVLLPVRPNGSTGWVRADDVKLSEHRYRIAVALAAHRITVYRGDEVILEEPVALGTTDTPTPGGRFYITELLRPPDPTTVYGPYAYGLSGFSNVLTSFAGGEGVIGIHGNNDPTSLGKDVSAGCIRMSNDGITFLARTLPLGTPVEINA